MPGNINGCLPYQAQAFLLTQIRGRDYGISPLREWSAGVPLCWGLYLYSNDREPLGVLREKWDLHRK